MKKIIAVLLTAIIAFSASTVAFAQDKAYPVIFVPGYTSSKMFIDRGTENERIVWKIDVAEKIIDAFKKELPSIIKNSGDSLSGNYTPLFDTMKPYADEVTEYLRMNDDGTSKYDVEVYPHSVEMTSLDKLIEYGYYPDFDTLKLLDKYETKKNIFSCTLDWRLGQVDNARVLNDYIDDVLEYTGAEKVNLIGVSYGGQVTASYLSLYGGDKVNNVVLHSPALNGSSILSQVFGGVNFKIAWSDLLKLLQTFNREGLDLSDITSIASPDFLNGFCKAFSDYYFLDLFKNFGSAWDLVPLNDYVRLRDRLLTDGSHDTIIEKSDKYHFEIAANMKSTLQKLRDEGVDISIIASYGYRLALDNGMSSDTVIETASLTGAVCSEVGATLGNDYKHVECGNPGHCHISPDNCVDAATGYLPENTWYVADMFHGLATNEDVAADLIGDLLFTEDIKDVHSNLKYPQFLTSDNSFRDVFCTFSNCAQGYLTEYSTEMTIKNVSKSDGIIIDGISASGLCFGYKMRTYLAPGESVNVTVGGNVPADLTALGVTLNYISDKDKACVAKSRTQFFRFTSGALLDDVLFDTVDEKSLKIKDITAEREGHNDEVTFISRMFYFFKQLLKRFSAFLAGLF